MNHRLDRLVGFFEHFSPQDVASLGLWYADDAAFKDPFNDVRGLLAIQLVYAHMFEALQEPRFAVQRRMAQGDEAWLAWELRFRSRGRMQSIAGATHLLFAPDGRIAVHRDYWDAAGELYEKVPLLGALMRAIRRRLAAPQG